MPTNNKAERLRAIQEKRAQDEDRARQGASDPDERRTHERRADKASYLQEKLEEQAESLDDDE